jgi:hypothetical protein
MLSMILKQCLTVTRRTRPELLVLRVGCPCLRQAVQHAGITVRYACSTKSPTLGAGQVLDEIQADVGVRKMEARKASKK